MPSDVSETGTTREPETLRECYRMIRSEHDCGRLQALMVTPIVIVVAAAAENKLEKRCRRRERIKREERWRQEVRAESGETTNQEADNDTDNA